MRRLLFTTVSFAAAMACVAAASPAAARVRHPYVAAPPVIQDRYCLQGRIWGYPGNCQFSSYEQCMATASGTNAYCDVNPVYLFPPQHPPGR